MIAVCRHVNLLIKKTTKEELPGKEPFDFSASEGKWLQGFQYALTEEEDWDPDDLQFTQLLYRGTQGDVIIDYMPSVVNGDGNGELEQAFKAEDFGFEKGSQLDDARRALLYSMMLNMGYENVFSEEYSSIAEYSLERKSSDILVREECPSSGSLYLSKEFGRKKLDFDTFVGFELWYNSVDIDESRINEKEVPDPDDFNDEPEMITIKCIAHDYLEDIASDSDGEHENMNLVGFGVSKPLKH